jgi:hypothetical protein
MNAFLLLFSLIFRVAAFGGIVVLNFWTLARFLELHLRRRRERNDVVAQRRKLAADRRGKPSNRSESSSDGEITEGSPRATNTSSTAGRIRSKPIKSE